MESSQIIKNEDEDEDHMLQEGGEYLDNSDAQLIRNNPNASFETLMHHQ